MKQRPSQLRRPVSALLIAGLAACSGAESPPRADGGDAAPFISTCTLPAPSEEATAPAGPHPERPAEGTLPATPAGWVQLGGRDLTPVGRLIPVGGYPLSLRALPAPYERFVLISSAGVSDNYLLLVDTSLSGAAAITARVTYRYARGDEYDPALFFGLALAQQGGLRAFASGGGYNLAPPAERDPLKQLHTVDAYRISGSPPTLLREAQLALPRGPTGLRYPAGLALSADEKTLYIAGHGDGSLTAMSAERGATLGQILGSVEDLGSFPYDVVLDESAGRAYVSLLGGELRSSKPLQVRDGLVAVDISDPRSPRRVRDNSLDLLLTTGRASEQLLRSGRRLLVSAADGDRVTSLDLDKLLVPLSAVPTTLDLTQGQGGLRGSSPTGMAVDPARGRLYVASARDNAVLVLDLATLNPIGRLPTAAYPTSVAVLPGGALAVACARGSNYFPSDQLPQDKNPAAGVVQIIPADEDPVRGDAIVQRNNERPRRYATTPRCSGPARFPLPLPGQGGARAIDHVFLVVRENKTYDAILGDQPGTRGRPDLLLYRPQATPNLHALATRFANLDNFYANADQSIQGHLWTTAAFVSDFSESAWQTTWGRGSRAQATFGGSAQADYITQGGSGSLFQAMDRAGISYHNYGELVNSQSAKVGLDVSFPGAVFNLDVLDVTKADYVVGRLQEPGEAIERFHYIGLTNDHTFGTQPGKPTPDSMVADNDEATGRLIAGLSRSPYWGRSIVFVIEDDPADGVDHIESHRSLCLAISPWVRKGHVSHVNYDDPSLWRTIELLLGLPATNQLTASAAPMYDLFIGAGEAPDLSPYTAIPRQIPPATNPKNAVMAKESAAIDFSRPDSASLTRILWRAQKGVEPPSGAADPDSLLRPLAADDDDD